MKRFYFFALLLFVGLAAHAQQNVSLQINHKLGALPFQFGTAATNNLGNPIKVTRMHYYIAEITLIHDGGTETMVPDTWILVNAGQATSVDLGSFPVTNLEAVRFGVGVQSAYNHLNPSTYPAQHPLYLQSPSMHWGWSSGYFFAATEGQSGNNFVQNFEIHALEDANYYQTTVTTAGILNGQDLLIELDADYEMAYKDINMNTSIVIHGGSGPARTLLQNFRDFVFAPALATSIATPSNTSFSIAPNPTASHTRLHVEASTGETTFVVYDYTGRILKTVAAVAGTADLDIAVAGCYLVALQQDGQTLATKRLIVAQ